MHIISLGLDYTTSSLKLREKFAFSQKEIPAAITTALENEQYKLSEIIILSTCNRVEIYCVTSLSIRDGFQALKKFITEFHKMPMGSLETNVRLLSDINAVNHLFEVAASIKSMVLGENQIQGQIKSALEISSDCKGVGTVLGTLFRKSLSVGKRVRNETCINEKSLSVSQAAVSLLKKSFAHLENMNILVIGKGKMGTLAIKALVKARCKKLTLLSRTIDKNLDFPASEFIKLANWKKFDSCLQEADIVISSTSSPKPILTLQNVGEAIAKRKNRPLFLVDIAVPRDIEAQVADIEGVSLVNIDSLKTRVNSNLKKRAAEVEKVKKIVEEELDKYKIHLQSLAAKPVIKDLKDFAEEIRSEELQRIFRKYKDQFSDQDSQVMDELTKRIINKMLHEPIVRLRKETGAGNGYDYTSTVRNLFGLSERETVN